MRLSLLATTFTGAIAASLAIAPAFAPAFAQQAAPSGPLVVASEEDQQRDVVTVTATRTEKRVDEVPATVSVISAEQIENELATDIKDLIRFEPGVSVRNSPSRFGAALGSTGRDGNSGFNIRGLEGNRVLIQTDGVRVPDSYTFGAQAQGRGDYVDLDLLKSVEILRGPASALYGSDGVAGVVSFVTRDPEDLIREGRSFAVRARSAYASADDSWANSLIGATKAGDFSALVAYTRRDGHEQENQGQNFALNSTRTAPNPTDAQSDSWLGKIVWTPGDNHRFRLTYDRLDRDIEADVITGRTAPPATGPLAATAVLNLHALDTTWRERFTLDHTWALGDGFLREARWSLYSQAAKTRQYTFEDRNTAADRVRDTTFDNRVVGANGQLSGGFVTGPAQHTWLLGADWSSTTQTSIRTGTVPPAGETFPSRPFPKTEYDITGVYLQDEISLLNGALLLYPALRYDSYDLSPTPDALYPANLPAADSSGDHVSPKFGVVAWPTDWFGAFASYAEGYKAPAPSQVNNGFANPLQNYTSIANPDLKPESSQSWEAGLRLRNVNLFGGALSGSVTAFAADYDDFIEQVMVAGNLTPANPGIFQFVNLTEVSVTGVEARVDLAWRNGFSLIAAASKADGEQGGGQPIPLQSVEPFKLVAGLNYADPQGRFGGQLVATHSSGKDVDDVSNTGTTTLFLPDDFTILDLTAYWNVTDWATLRVGTFNLTDETYWWWGDVRGLAATSTIRDAYTQPGRNYSASLTLRY